jgi:hypothetical protein
MTGKKRGPKVGSKRDGAFGYGVKTKVVRIPEYMEASDLLLLQEVIDVIWHYREDRKKTRDWTQAWKMIDELTPLIASVKRPPHVYVDGGKDDSPPFEPFS